MRWWTSRGPRESFKRDEQGKLLDQNFVRRVDGFLNELIWMARVLRHGRENVAPI